MTEHDLYRLTTAACFHPCEHADAVHMGLPGRWREGAPVLLNLSAYPCFRGAGAVFYRRKTDRTVDPHRRYAELNAVLGGPSDRKTPDGRVIVEWYTARLAEVPSLDLPDSTEDERAALLAALPVPE